MTPLHVAPIGTKLPHDYFSPGVFEFKGVIRCSLWAIAYWRGESYRYERTHLGAPWIRTI